MSIITPKRSEERVSRNDETDLVCRLLLEKKSAGRRSWLAARLPKPAGAAVQHRAAERVCGLPRDAGPFFSQLGAGRRPLHSFPTRRSSDLAPKGTKNGF